MLCAGAPRAEALTVITVDKTAQRLTVQVNGTTQYDWPVSTARWGYRTPNGTYRPERLERQWYSRKYDWSPMPYSIFFKGGYAIHGSNEVSRLGRPASHGCIRLHPNNAATLFNMVKADTAGTRIVIAGDTPSEPMISRAVPRAPRHVVQDDDYNFRTLSPRRATRATVYDDSFEGIFDEPPRRYRRY